MCVDCQVLSLRISPPTTREGIPAARASATNSRDLPPQEESPSRRQVSASVVPLYLAGRIVLCV